MDNSDYIKTVISTEKKTSPVWKKIFLNTQRTTSKILKLPETSPSPIHYPIMNRAHKSARIFPSLPRCQFQGYQETPINPRPQSICRSWEKTLNYNGSQLEGSIAQTAQMLHFQKRGHVLRARVITLFCHHCWEK